jgi:hypothetical protein
VAWQAAQRWTPSIPKSNGAPQQSQKGGAMTVSFDQQAAQASPVAVDALAAADAARR